jgi:hypothetical protein
MYDKSLPTHLLFGQGQVMKKKDKPATKSAIKKSRKKELKRDKSASRKEIKKVKKKGLKKKLTMAKGEMQNKKVERKLDKMKAA